ncbi:MAG: putative polysaccharide deacetylase [Candidatus Carbobacillus altaicus]|uniref:Putative polysaccharide deacetylase n=1 Tax=Candidatus Carbonibacillus altaicus TaxID=2163959 RepID=A0A2R6Y2P6_9BACL|nr:MAG: putative polysaccharide deacetylase [Candidatus Carbobacillus altaicus]
MPRRLRFWMIISWKKSRRVLAFFFIVFASLIILYNERDVIVAFKPREAGAIYHVPTDEKLISLTFDISWGEVQVQPVMETLQKEGVLQATFFVSAPWAKDHTDIVKKMIQTGFELGTLGNRHMNYTRLDEATLLTEIKTGEDVLKSITGQSVSLFRPPNGDFDQKVLKTASSLGLTTVLWSIDAEDWKNPGRDVITSRVLKSAKPGAIVLLHASDSAKETPEALADIIRGLKRDGYRFKTVSELISGYKDAVHTVP